MDVNEFEGLRRYLFSIAYRMLGSASEADDIVQEAYLRLQDAPDEPIHSPKAYLSTVVTRLCLDHLKAARVAREAYRGPWLAEPVPSVDLEPTASELVERGEAVSLAFITLLERLTPEERAVYVLREAFGYPYDEIAEIVGKSTTATRQLAHRARQRVAAGEPRFTTSPDVQRRLTERFLAAARHGDMQALTEILTVDATVWVDGGADVRAARRPIRSRDAVARLILGSMRKVYADARATIEEVNGRFAILFWDGDTLISATTVETTGSRIAALHAVMNPTKLAYLRHRLLIQDGPGTSNASVPPQRG